MLGEGNPNLDQPLPRTTMLPVVREGRQPTIPLRPPGKVRKKTRSLSIFLSICSHPRFHESKGSINSKASSQEAFIP